MKTANPELEAWGFFIKEQKPKQRKIKNHGDKK
jgi:hypothetical protein